jgi:tetratricopeptide (TPR) repeat protein
MQADMGNWGAVADENQMAVELDPNEATYRRYLGISLLNYAVDRRSEIDFSKTEHVFKELIKRDPLSPEGYVGLGNTYVAENKILKKNTLRQALKEYKRADVLAVYSPLIRVKIAKVLLNMGEKKKALDELNYILKIDTDNYKNYINLSDGYLQAGQYRQAEEILKRAKKIWPTETEITQKLNNLKRRKVE